MTIRFGGFSLFTPKPRTDVVIDAAQTLDLGTLTGIDETLDWLQAESDHDDPRREFWTNLLLDKRKRLTG